jgi:hypothetical protein
MKQNITLIILILTGLCNQAWSQEPGIEADKLEVVKSFEAQLKDAKMIEVQPIVPPVIPVNKVYNYNVTIVPLKLEYPAPLIRPLAMNESNTFDHHNHFIRLGYGTLSNPEGVLRLSFMGGDRYKIVARAKYFSVDNSKNIEFQKMSNLDLGLGGFARLNDNVIFNFNSDFSTNQRYFYDNSSNDISAYYGDKRNNSHIGTTIGFSNIDKTTYALNWEVKTKALIDRVKGLGNGIGVGIEAQIEKRSNEHINIVFPVESNFYDSDIESDEAILYTNFEPNIHFQKGKFQTTVGIDLYNDKTLGTKVWPEIELAYGVLGNYVQVLVGTKQDYQFQSINALSQYNPWISLINHKSHSMIWNEYYGGLRGELNFLSYQVEGGYKQANQALLIKDTLITEGNVFQAFNDDVNSVFVRGNIDFALSKAMNLGGTMTQNIYDPKTSDKAFGLPETSINAYFNWKLLNDKLRLRSDLFVTDRVFTQELNNDGVYENVTLNSQLDLNAEATFWFTKNISVFGYARNLLNNKYRRWRGYPTVGINFGGGLQAKF